MPIHPIKHTAEKIGTKPFIIMLLVLLMLIPLHMIRSIITDREFYRDQAIHSVLLPKGGQPVLEGLAAALPYQIITEERRADGTSVHTVNIEYIISVPETWNFSTEVKPEYLVRGIFDVPVFSCDTVSDGTFEPAAFRHFKIEEHDILWDEALLLVGISNKKNFTALPEIQVSDTVLEQSLSEPDISPFSHTVFYRLPAQAVKNGFSYTMYAPIQGGNSLSILPIASDNHFQLTSNWPAPSFSGGWLPTQRNISADGFSAEWNIAGLSTVFPKSWIAAENHGIQTAAAEAVTAAFITPVDNYQKTMRSVKYALLFLIIPFLTVFIFEIFTRIRIHPVQYCLIGLADVLFYLLLLAVSEHLPFSVTYWISAAAVCAATFGYTTAIFRQAKWGALFVAVQAASYIFLFGTLQAEDYALLIGTIGLFCVTIILMILTRRIDWYTVISSSADAHTDNSSR